MNVKTNVKAGGRTINHNQTLVRDRAGLKVKTKGKAVRLPVRSIARNTMAVLFLFCGAAGAENRSFDGSGNSRQNPQWGTAKTIYGRVAPPAYGDRISSPSGADRPGPREVSNAVGNQTGLVPISRNLSGYVYAFGQFLNHDVQQTKASGEFLPITTPNGDRHFQGAVLPLLRSSFDLNTGTGIANPRQQLNYNTSYLDASNVYGSDQIRADKLREASANGLGARLLTNGTQNLLPLATSIDVEVDNGGFQERSNLVVAGDIRAGENASLASLHTLFMREHNRLVDQLAIENPTWSNDQLYQRARKFVGAEMQVITYDEFLPALLGSHAPNSHATYSPSMDASVINEFAAVFLRVGHSLLGNDFRRIQNDGTPDQIDPLVQGATIFNVPQWLSQTTDLDLFLKGLSVDRPQEVDTLFTDEHRNVVFAFVDLLSIDLQRARDHGLTDYNTMRTAYGLPAVATFSEITSDPVLAATLEQLYGDVNRIDPLVGTLAEDHLPGASVGPLAAAGLTEQFNRLRDGDRFWYENDPEFMSEEIAMLRGTRLSDIIRRNTGITNLPDDVFFVPPLGDFDGDGHLDVADIDALTRAVHVGQAHVRFDVNGDSLVDNTDRKTWITELRKTWIGDANLDGEFNSSDMMQVFQAGRYEQLSDATWSQGDWTGNLRFDSSDLVAAFQDGGYETGPRAAVASVPEPENPLRELFGLALLSTIVLRRRNVK